MKIAVLERFPENGSEMARESTSKGDQRKWYCEGEFVKADRLGYEGLAEWASYQLLLCSNISENLITPYYLCKITTPERKIVDGCVSRNFLNPGEELITLHRLLRSEGLDLDDLGGTTVESKVRSVVSFLVDLTGLDTRDLYEYFQHMLVFDGFVLNEDRHLNNIAFLRDLDGNWDLAPLFDHGLSLLSDKISYNDNYSISTSILSVTAKPFHEDFVKQMKSLEVDNPFRIYSDKLDLFLQNYGNEIGRVKDVIEYQRERFKYLFI